MNIGMHRNKLLLCALPLSILLTAGDACAQTESNPMSAVTGTDGALEVSDKPTAQQLLERAQYWENHGRSDIAAQIRARLPYAPARSAVAPPVTAPPVVAPPVAAPVVTARPVVTPLAPAPTPVRRISAAPSTVPVASGPSSLTGSQPSAQDLAQQASYWEAHGRDDLASQIRQRLQQLSPRQAAPASSLAFVPAPATSLSQPAAAPHTALENSLLNSPNSQDSRLDLAQVYRGTGDTTKARALVDSVLASKPHYPAALFASAQLYGDQHRWRDSLNTLEKVPPAARTAEMANLQKIAWAHVQLDRADTLVRLGRNAEARLLLRRIALELSIDADQTALAEPPPLWKPAPASAKRKKAP